MDTWWPVERADTESSMTCCIFLPKTSSILWEGWVPGTRTEHWAKIITLGLSHTLVSVLGLSVKKPSTEFPCLGSQALAGSSSVSPYKWLRRVPDVSNRDASPHPSWYTQLPVFFHYHDLSGSADSHPSSTKPGDSSADRCMPFVGFYTHWLFSLVSFPTSPYC